MDSGTTLNVTLLLHDQTERSPQQTLCEFSSCLGELISDEDTALVLKILMYCVIPTVGAFGMAGNIISMIILVKHGLGKCSNILLFALALSDCGVIIAFNSPFKIVYELVGTPYAFDSSQSGAFALYVFYIIFNTMDYVMGYTTITIPMLITFERLIAVFWPLKFNSIITPFRTWFAAVFVFVFWLCNIGYTSFWFTFMYAPKPGQNVSVGLVERSALYFHDFGSVDAIEEFQVYLTIRIPPCFTVIGCIAISIRIKMMSAQRKKLTSSNMKPSSSNRRTKMLLAVCAAYTVTCAVFNLSRFLPDYVFFTLTRDAPSNVGLIMYQLINMVGIINSSCNFVIYVGMNKNFRDTYKSMFHINKCCKPAGR